jgi:hypothetical protein
MVKAITDPKSGSLIAGSGLNTWGPFSPLSPNNGSGKIVVSSTIKIADFESPVPVSSKRSVSMGAAPPAAPPGAGGFGLGESEVTATAVNVGPAFLTSLPARYPAELSPINCINPDGIVGSPSMMRGSLCHTMLRNVPMPMIVQIRNWSRSGATTPPVQTKSERFGPGLPAPLFPLALVMPVDTTTVPTLASKIPGSPGGMSGNTPLPCTKLFETARYTYPNTAVAVHA